MAGRALGNRVSRLERQNHFHDLTRLSPEELRRQADELLASFPEEIRQLIEPFRRSGDAAGEYAAVKRLIDDAECRPAGPS